MKTLSELKPGDYIYIIYYSNESDCILNVFKRVVRIVTEISTGKIIKWDSYKDSYLDNKYYSHTLEKDNYNDYIDTFAYECTICSDRDLTLDLIEKDRQKQMKKYDKILNRL